LTAVPLGTASETFARFLTIIFVQKIKIMNKLIILVSVFALFACKTTSGISGDEPKKRIAPTFQPQYADFAQPTDSKDTLYLLSESTMAIMTKQLWDNDTVTKNKPVILLVNENDMICIKKRCNGKVN
jgi:cell division protein FtsW (lipid II flippase)